MIKSYSWITLAQTKSYLGVSSSGYDSTISVLINGVIDFIEKQTGGRRFVRPSSSATGYYDGGDGYQTRLLLRDYPVSSTGTVTFQYNNGTFSTPSWVDFDTDDYQIYYTEGFIQFPSGLPQGNKNIKVVCKAGYDNSTGTSGANFPQDLTTLAMSLVGRRWNKRKSGAMTSEGLGSANVSWDKELEPEDRLVLNSYKRITF